MKLHSTTAFDGPERLGFLVSILAFGALNLNIICLALGFLSPAVAYFYVIVALLMFFISICYARRLWPLLIFLPLILVSALSEPIVDWDARSIWFFHSKRMFYDHSLWAQLDGYAQWSHNDYPPFLSAAGVVFPVLFDRWNEFLPKTGVIIVLLPVFFLAGILFRRPLVLCFWILSVVLLSGQLLWNGYADAILAVYASVALFCVIRSDDFRIGAIGIALFFLVFSCALIKNEGLLFCFLLLVFLPFFLVSWKLFVSVIGAIFFAVLFWKLPVVLAGIGSDLFAHDPLQMILARLLSVENLSQISRAFRSSGALGFFLIVFVLVFVSRVNRIAVSMVLISAYVSFLFVVYLLTPNDLVWHLQTSVDRVLLVSNVLSVSVVMFWWDSIFGIHPVSNDMMSH